MSLFSNFMGAKSSPPEMVDESEEAKQFQSAVNKKMANKTSRSKKLSAMVGRVVGSVHKSVKSKTVSFASNDSESKRKGDNFIKRNKEDPSHLSDIDDDDDIDDNESFLDPELEIVDLNGVERKQPIMDTSSSNGACKTSKKGLTKKSDKNLEDYDSKLILPEEDCDIPTFLHTKNCDRHLIDETRRLLKERYERSPDFFYDDDYNRMMSHDWTVSRFLLRRRMDPKRTAKLMEECGKFRRQFKMSEVELWEFPVEFHKAGGLFKYAADRVGNITVYMRVKMYRRVPEISDVFKAFILCVLEEADRANEGRGVAVVFDLTGCGLQNVDLGFLSWLLSSFRNYCPKGVSYILVYNLPWILNATCKLAMSWLSASNRRSLRFVHGDEIENFVARDNLPDYLGGTCKINYRAIPHGSKPAIEVCDRLDMTREQALKIRELFKEYLGDEDEEQNAERNAISGSINSDQFLDADKTLFSDNEHEATSDLESSVGKTTSSVSSSSELADTTQLENDVSNIKLSEKAPPGSDNKLLSRATKFLAS